MNKTLLLTLSLLSCLPAFGQVEQNNPAQEALTIKVISEVLDNEAILADPDREYEARVTISNPRFLDYKRHLERQYEEARLKYIAAAHKLEAAADLVKRGYFLANNREFQYLRGMLSDAQENLIGPKVNFERISQEYERLPSDSITLVRGTKLKTNRQLNGFDVTLGITTEDLRRELDFHVFGRSQFGWQPGGVPFASNTERGLLVSTSIVDVASGETITISPNTFLMPSKDATFVDVGLIGNGDVRGLAILTLEQADVSSTRRSIKCLNRL